MNHLRLVSALAFIVITVAAVSPAAAQRDPIRLTYGTMLGKA